VIDEKREQIDVPAGTWHLAKTLATCALTLASVHQVALAITLPVNAPVMSCGDHLVAFAIKR
jgi:hypothetical protein